MGVYATFLFWSNLISKVIESHWTNPEVNELHDRTERIRDVLIERTQKQNHTMLAVEAVQEAVVNQATLIHHNLAEIDRIAFSHLELIVVSARIISRIVSVASQLDLLKIEFWSERPNLELLLSLTDTALLDDVDQDTIPRQSVLIEAINEEVFEVRFSARGRDSTTSVYEMEAFDFWADPTEETPALVNYEGPRYLIYNHTNHCVESVSIGIRPLDRV